jgi:hypothetical protein
VLAGTANRSARTPLVEFIMELGRISVIFTKPSAYVLALILFCLKWWL